MKFIFEYWKHKHWIALGSKTKIKIWIGIQEKVDYKSRILWKELKHSLKFGLMYVPSKINDLWFIILWRDYKRS